jgi:probable HAF family extracellular repeat protein
MRRFLHFTIFRVGAAALVALLFAASTCFAQMYTVTDLGTLGGSSSHALAINSVGQITGKASTASESHAFLWTSGKMEDLGSPGWASVGTAINASGQVVGITYHLFPFSPSHAVLFANGGVVDLGAMGGVSSYAYSINNSGQVSVCAEGSPDGEAFLYNSASGNIENLAP